MADVRDLNQIDGPEPDADDAFDRAMERADAFREDEWLMREFGPFN